MKKYCLVFGIMILSTCRLSAQNEFSSGVINIGVVVSDLNKSIDFYTNIIGMIKTGGFGINEDFAKRSGLSNGIPFDVVILKLEDSPQATEWKLMSFNNKIKSSKEKFIQDNRGMQYTTIFVRSLNPVLERIKAHNIKLLGETPTKLKDGKGFVLIQDPDGTFIELIGPMN